jgi:anti-anti-sigma factor
MELNVKNEEKGMLVSLTGRMDAVSSPEFEKELGRLIDERNVNFVVDLTELDYISSAGLRSILVTAKKLKGKNGQILLASLQAAVVKEVFEISGFSTIIPIYESVEEAMAVL